MNQRTNKSVTSSLLRGKGLLAVITLVVLLGMLGVVGFVRPAHVTHADPPVITVPGPITVTAGPTDTATITYPTPVTVTDGDGDVVLAVIPCTSTNGGVVTATGGTFMLGTSVVTCSATSTDIADDPALTTASFTVTVNDIAPTFSGVPGPITVDSMSSAGATVSYGSTITASEADTPPETITPSCTASGTATSVDGFLSSGSFPIGSTTVTCTATDSDATTSDGPVVTSTTVMFVVNVVEPAPVFDNPPGNQTKTAGVTDTATFTFATPVTAHEPANPGDPDGELATVTCTVSSPVTLGLGVHPESCTATDTTDNGANPVIDNFTLTVADEPTSLSNPGNQTAVANATDTALVSYPTVTATEQPSGESDAITPVCTPQAGSTATSGNGFISSGTFPLGVTTITCNATDTTDGTTPPGINATPIHFTVTVTDQPVTLTVPPSPVVANATSPAGAAVTYGPVTAKENGETETNPITITCKVNTSATSNNGFISGGNFPIGGTLVTCTAKDPDGGSATKSFLVHVKGAIEQLNDLCNAFPGLAFGNDDGSFCTQLHVVIAELQLGQTSQACVGLTVITGEVFLQEGHALSIADAQFILTALARIQNVIGCPPNASFDQR